MKIANNIIGSGIPMLSETKHLVACDHTVNYFESFRRSLSQRCNEVLIFFHMQVARHIMPEGHLEVWATIIFVLGPLRAETGLPPLQSIWMQAWLSSIRSLAGRAESTTSQILHSKCHDPNLNPHSADQMPEFESGAHNCQAMTCLVNACYI